MSGMADPKGPMTMTFSLSTTTPLLLSSWRPKNPGEYVASCLFLVALAALTRVLIAIRPVLDAASWRRRPKYHRQGQEHDGDEHEHENNDVKRQLPRPELPASGWRAIKVAVQDHWGNAAPSSRLARAGFDMLIAGLGYLV